MFGCDKRGPGLVGAVGEEASARLSERWRACTGSVHAIAETVTGNSEGCRSRCGVSAVPMMDLPFNFVNSGSPALVMESGALAGGRFYQPCSCAVIAEVSSLEISQICLR